MLGPELTDYFARMKEMPAIARAFRQMKIAEDSIKRAQQKYSDKEDEIFNSFMLLQPGNALEGCPDTLYEVHCSEILDRVAAGEDTRPGTNAEILWIFHSTSLLGPTSADFGEAYRQVFAETFPDNELSTSKSFEMLGYESFPGAAKEIIEGTRKRATDKKRRQR